MPTPRPVSMQRIRGAFDSLHMPFQEVGSGLWQQVQATHVVCGTVEGGKILCFKGTSTRTYTADEDLVQLGHFVTMSNRNRAFPKAYIEAFETPGKYTVGAETSRLITSGLSEAQFNDFLEHAFLVITSFFQEFEGSAIAQAGVRDDD